MAAPKRLPLVAAGEELSGDGPIEFERLARTLTPASDDHRGLVQLVVTLARDAIRGAVPPSSAKTLYDALDVAEGWARREVNASAVRSGRATAFAALPIVERSAVGAIEKLLAQNPTDETALTRHADHVVLRYVSLGAHFATSATCHALDAVEQPEAALEVARDVIGARSYQKAGLGAARSPEFRARSLEQATWEASRETSRALHHTVDALAPQIFHEYLGARWRVLAASERAVTEDFIRWALGGRVRH